MIIGNEKQINFLKELLLNLEKGVILIFGPEGVGKFCSLKNFLTKEIGAGTKQEVIFVDSENKILTIETARKISSLSIRKSDKRIIVINEAHKFSVHSQNTLLKILEDIPSKTIFILITHNFYRILPTIRSRSILVKFSLIDKETMISFLKEKGYSQDEINLALDFYPGQIGKALNFLNNRTKRELLGKFIKAGPPEKLLLIEDLKEVFSLDEFLEYYLLAKRIFLRNFKGGPAEIKNFKNLINFWAEAKNYNLNFEIHLANLVFNNG